MKYVMIRINIAGVHRDMPVIFPDLLVHANVAEAMKAVMKDAQPEVVSAGTIYFDSVDCHGESESLGVGSRSDVDEDIIKDHDYHHGIVRSE